MKNKANYNQLLVMASSICQKYYDTDKKMFGPAVKTKQDEKNIIFTVLKNSLNNASFSYEEDDLKLAVSVAVEGANVKKFPSIRPPSY